MDILGVDNVLFAVGDVLLARRFYTDVLGLTEAFAFAEAGIVGYKLGSEEPGLLIRLDPDLVPGPPLTTPRLWLEVPDARAAEVTLRDRGAEPIEAPRQAAYRLGGRGCRPVGERRGADGLHLWLPRWPGTTRTRARPTGPSASAIRRRGCGSRW